MSEVILIKFHDPGFEVLSSYPHKIVLEETHMEAFSKAEVKFEDDDDGLKKQNWIDQVRFVLKRDVTGVEVYRGKKYQDFVLRIPCRGFVDDFDMYFEDRADAKEVYTKIKNWLLNANS